MTAPNLTLAQLRLQRDLAYSHMVDHVDEMKNCVRSIDVDVESFTQQNPVAALGGAAAIGVVAGLLVGIRPIRMLAEASMLAIARPMADDAVNWVLQSIKGEPGNPPPSFNGA